MSFFSTKPNLLSIVNYDMTGAVKADPEWFDEIPDECILTNMEDTTEYKDNNGGHPYLLSKVNASEIDKYYSGKYLITGIRHKLSGDQYTTDLELVKDSFNDVLPSKVPTLTGGGGK